MGDVSDPFLLEVAGISTSLLRFFVVGTLLNQSTSVNEYLTIEGERVPVEFRPSRLQPAAILFRI